MGSWLPLPYQKANLRFNFLYHYNLLSTQTDLLNCVPLELLQDTDLSISTIAPHWSSSYPEYFSPDWDKDTQWAVVWTRLQELWHKLANWSLATVNERLLALHQEQQLTQAKSSHKLLSGDIKSNLLTASRAEKGFKAGLPLNQRGEHILQGWGKVSQDNGPWLDLAWVNCCSWRKVRNHLLMWARLWLASLCCRSCSLIQTTAHWVSLSQSGDKYSG